MTAQKGIGLIIVLITLAVNTLYGRIDIYYSLMHSLSILAYIVGVLLILWPYSKIIGSRRLTIQSLLVIVAIVGSSILLFELGELLNTKWLRHQIGEEVELAEGTVIGYSRESIGAKIKSHYVRFTIIRYNVGGDVYQTREKLGGRDEFPVGTRVKVMYSKIDPNLALVLE